MSKPQSIQVLARHGKSFYWASYFLGSSLAFRAARLYEFCRFVDDIADGDLPNRQESLQEIHHSLVDSVSSAQTSKIPELNDFLNLAKEANIPLVAAHELLEGMLLDQKPVEFKTEIELLRYCHAVAGTVGLMMCRVLNCSHARADSFAIDLGIAMQLTNIARDVLEDGKMGRRYIPASWLKIDVSPMDIKNSKHHTHQPVSNSVDQLLTLAEKYYKSALVGIRLLPFRSRFAIAVALRIYRQIGIVLRRRKLAWWSGRVMVGKSEKFLLSIRSLGELIPVTVPEHDGKLHKHLKGLAGVSNDQT